MDSSLRPLMGQGEPLATGKREPVMDRKRVALVTGASAGIGRAAALALSKRGWIVYGAARRSSLLEELAPQGVRPVVLDVTQSLARQAAIERIRQEEGRLEALVNNAGYGSFGSLEEVPLEEARRQLEVNLLAVAGLIQEVLPLMRQQGGGRIVNLSSVAGQIYAPLGGWYFASKHALEGLSDSLRLELKGQNIKVSLIEPGIIRSQWSDLALDSLQRYSGSGPYAGVCQRTLKFFRWMYASPWSSTPETIARVIVRALESKYPKARYAAPLDAKLMLILKKYLPDWAFELAVRALTT